MALKKDKMAVHYFKVAYADDPKSSDAMAAAEEIKHIEGVIAVEYIRTAIKSKEV